MSNEGHDHTLGSGNHNQEPDDSHKAVHRKIEETLLLMKDRNARLAYIEGLMDGRADHDEIDEMRELEWPDPRISEEDEDADYQERERLYAERNRKIEEFLTDMRFYAETPVDLQAIREALLSHPDIERRRETCPEFMRYIMNLGTIIDCVRACRKAGAHIWGEEPAERDKLDEQTP